MNLFNRMKNRNSDFYERQSGPTPIPPNILPQPKKEAPEELKLQVDIPTNMSAEEFLMWMRGYACSFGHMNISGYGQMIRLEPILTALKCVKGASNEGLGTQ